MRKFTKVATVSLIVAAAGACGGGGGSSISDLGQVRSKLTDAGISCPKPPAPYQSDDDGFSLGAADPASELECTSHDVKLTASLWKDASGKTAALAVAKSFICGFGESELSMIEGDNWGLAVDDLDSDTDKEDAALAKAAEALGIEPTTHKCDKSSSDDAKGSSAASDDTTEETSAPTTTVATSGDRSKPLAVGESAKVGDFEVTVDSITPDATSQVQSANEFNDPPSKGQYAEVSFTAVYDGTDEGSPAMDLSVVLSGADKVQYRASDCMAALDSDYSTIEPGGKLQVTVCIDAPADAITGGLIFVESTFSFSDDDRAYWKLP